MQRTTGLALLLFGLCFQLIGHWGTRLVGSPSVPGIQFTEIAEKAGIDFQHVSGSPEKKYILESMSGGVACIDYDRDGWLDLYLVNGGDWEGLLQDKRRVSNALYRNNHD